MALSDLQQPANRKILYILGGIFIFSVIILITGIVLIVVGSHKLSEKKNCPACTVPMFNASTVSGTSWDPTIPWDNQYLNMSSRQYNTLRNRLQAESLASLSAARMSPMPIAAAIQGFQPSPINGTVFYMTYIFSVANAPSETLQKHLNKRWATFTDPDTLSQCSSVFIPDFTNPINPTNHPVTGVTAPNTNHPLPQGAYCDASLNNVQTTFLVDVARPPFGTLDDKLTRIRQYLTAYDESIGLHSTSWNSTKFDLIVYNGLGATSLGSCVADDCWHATVSKLNSTLVNPTGNDFHTVNVGLQYILNRLSAPVTGLGKNIIIITDGYDITDSPPNVLASDLKAHGFYIGAIVGTVNYVARQSFHSIASSDSYYYPIDDFTWLSNQAVFASSALWTCDAYYMTSPGPTTPSTRIPLITTPAPVTQKPAFTTPSPNAPVPSCPVDILFLIDDSSIMTANHAFSNSIAFTDILAYDVQQASNDSRFALITFNNKVIFSTGDYFYREQFMDKLNHMVRNPSYSLLSVGFTAAENLVSQKARYNKSGVKSILYFLSSGPSTNNTEVTKSQQHSHNLRVNYETQIISIGIDESIYTAELTREATDYYAPDGFIKSTFFSVNATGVESNSTIATALNAIQCRGSDYCSTNLIFAIEASSVEQQPYVDTQRYTVATVIQYLSDRFTATTGKVSVVYYSSSDKTGELFLMNDRPLDAINQLNNTDFSPLGSGSSIVYGIEEIYNALSVDQSGNNEVVVLLGRGASDPNVDAVGFAQEMRQRAFVQGVVIGRYPDQQMMEKVTGQKPLDGNALLVQNAVGQVNITASVSQLAYSIYSAIIPSFTKPACNPVPVLNKPCSQFDDVTIILHGSTSLNWQKIKEFTANLIIKNLYGEWNDNQINDGSPVNMALITYFGNNVTPVLSMDNVKSSQSIYNTIMALPYQNVSQSITNLLSRSYRMANQQMQLGRSAASKTVLVITDTVDFADYQSALNERARLPYSYIYGVRVDANSMNIVPGQDDGVTISSILPMSLDNPRSSVVLANRASNALCKVYLQPVIPPSTTPPVPSTPAPVPLVKVRDVWPDVTILIDVSQQTFENFQQLRLFLQSTFRDQFFVGPQGSRFTIATFDNSSTNVICSFSDILNYWSLYECLGTKLDYSSVSADTTRDINQALTYLNTNVYSSIAKSGFEPLNENYIFVFSLGSSSADFSTSVSAVRRQQVRTIAVDITKSMTASELSRFGPDSYVITNWMSDDVREALSSAIIAQITRRPTPPFDAFYSNFYFVVDQSAEIVNDIQNVRTFVRNFIDLLTLSLHRASVSITPFADQVSINNLGPSSRPAVVQSFLDSWTEVPQGNSNIGMAISEVYENMNDNFVNNGQNYVIFLVGANSTKNADVTQLVEANANLYVLDYNTRLGYASKLTDVPSAIFKLDGSASLDDWSEGKFPVQPLGRNPMNQFFNSLRDDQYAYNSIHFPTNQVAADILMFLDETGMSDDDFSAMKQFLMSFVDKFTISNSDTQFALQAFNGQNIPEAGFHLWESKSNDAVTTKISNLHLEQNPTTAPSDLTGAINQGLSFFLDPKNGWREGAQTYTLLFTNSKDFYQNPKQTAQALKISDVTQVFALSSDGAKPDFVNQFVNTGFFQVVNSPQFLKSNSGVGLNLVNSVTAEYKQQVYPTPPTLRSINADHIFLIDNSALTPSLLAQIKVFLKSFIYNVGDFTTGNANRLSVVNYNSQGVVLPTSWMLTTYSSNNQLNNAIDDIYASSNGLAPDLNAAIQYFAYSPEYSGITVNRTVFITAFVQSANISSPIPALTTKKINLNYFTYALQLGVNTPLPYLNQLLGVDFDDNYSVINDPSKYSPIADSSNPFYDFNSYMQSEYAAYTRMYGIQ